MRETQRHNWNLERSKLPKHVAIVMDGNGRWANERHRPRLFGHKKGVERVKEISEFAASIGLEALTLFAFSTENWKRPQEEVFGIFGLLKWYLLKESKLIIENNIRFRVIGNIKVLSLELQNLIEDLIQKTQSNTGLLLCVALNYGSQNEIVECAQNLVSRCLHGKLALEDMTASCFESYLQSSFLPPLDMFIRTSGEYRISNFLLWQLAYAELFFAHEHWPDFSALVFRDLLNQYSCRKRRFGKISEQTLSDMQC